VNDAEFKREVLASLARIERRVAGLNIEGEIIMSALDDLTAAVTAETTVDQSAVTLLQGLKTQLDAAIASNDPAKLSALSSQLGASTAALSAAIAANTPAAAPVPAPTAPAT
jgi:hypothetical protein